MSFRTICYYALVGGIAFRCDAAPPKESLKDRFVMVGDEAVGLLPAELVCSPLVVEAKWSPDGTKVLVVYRSERISPSLARTRALMRDPQEPPGDLVLAVWSRATHRTRDLWRRPLDRARIETIRWLPGSEKAVAIVTTGVGPGRGGRDKREVLWMRAESGPARTVAEIPADAHPPGWIGSPFSHRLEISPRRPLAIIVGSTVTEKQQQMTDGSTRTMLVSQNDLTTIRDDGSPAPTRHLLPEVDFVTWNEDGSKLLLQHLQWSPDRKTKPGRTWFEFDPRDGSMNQVATEPPDLRTLLKAAHVRDDVREDGRDDPGTMPIRLSSTRSELKDQAATVEIRPLWLESVGKSEQPRALVCANASWARLAPSGDAVLYASQGAVWVRPLIRVSGRDYSAMLREELRRRTVADANALARALQSLVEDREYLPRPDQLRDWLSPYLRESPGLLDRVTYTFGGGLRPRDPNEWASTRLGFLSGPGGRAIIFADGHAAWVDE